MQQRLTLTGSTMRSRTREQKADVTIFDESPTRWCRAGATVKLCVPLAKVFAIEEADAAYEYFAQPGKFGKVASHLGRTADEIGLELVEFLRAACSSGPGPRRPDRRSPCR